MPVALSDRQDRREGRGIAQVRTELVLKLGTAGGWTDLLMWPLFSFAESVIRLSSSTRTVLTL